MSDQTNPEPEAKTQDAPTTPQREQVGSTALFTVADMVNHPPHYTSHPSGVECIQVTEHYGFCIGSAIKYLWRAGLKGSAVEDLKKAVWYINREIAKREQLNTKGEAQPPAKNL